MAFCSFVQVRKKSGRNEASTRYKNAMNFHYLLAAKGFLRTRMTESPRKNILLMNLSLLTGLAFFLPLPVLGISVHISLTPSKTMLQCRSKAFTLPRSFLLFRQLIKTCVLFLTDCVRTDNGPVLNSSSSRRSSSSGVISDLALFIIGAAIMDISNEKCKRFKFSSNSPVGQLKGEFFFQFILILRIRMKEHPTLLLLFGRFCSGCLPQRLDSPSSGLGVPILTDQLPPHLLASQR